MLEMEENSKKGEKMRIIKLAEEEFLKPEDLNRSPDVKKAIKQTEAKSSPYTPLFFTLQRRLDS